MFNTSKNVTWWRHWIEIFYALLATWAGNSPVTDKFPTQRLVTRIFDIFFDLRLDKRLIKQSWGWWFETLLRPLWRHCNEFPYFTDVPLGHTHLGNNRSRKILQIRQTNPGSTHNRPLSSYWRSGRPVSHWKMDVLERDDVVQSLHVLTCHRFGIYSFVWLPMVLCLSYVSSSCESEHNLLRLTTTTHIW